MTIAEAKLIKILYQIIELYNDNKEDELYRPIHDAEKLLEALEVKSNAKDCEAVYNAAIKAAIAER